MQQAGEHITYVEQTQCLSPDSQGAYGVRAKGEKFIWNNLGHRSATLTLHQAHRMHLERPLVWNKPRIQSLVADKETTAAIEGKKDKDSFSTAQRLLYTGLRISL